MQNKEFYTPKEIAETLNLNYLTIIRYIKAKKIKAYKFGNQLRIEKEEYQKFLETNKK